MAIDEFVVDFPSLFIVPDWIEQHCTIPDRWDKGEPFRLYDWQLWCTVNHYRIKPDAKVGQLSTAFFYRRSLIVAPQKTGKGPWSAAIICAEALGPVVFDGWAKGGEVFACEDYGCYCGWEYEYRPGEPMGTPWPTPLIQLLACAEDQTANVYRPLQAMARHEKLSGRMKVGEGFIRLPNDGRIDTVTASARSRLGNPIIFALQDESGLYNDTNKLKEVATTQRRGAAGMQGRSMETTNPWDPTEGSTAQKTFESLAPDVFKFYRLPPPQWSFSNKEERRKILKYVYYGSNHIDIDAIEAEALEIMETDPGQAERFFGNRVTSGTATWCDPAKWEARKEKRPLPVKKIQVVLGFDGSDTDDWTALRAETYDVHQFTPTYGDGLPTIWNPADFDGQVPRLEVMAAFEEIFKRYKVIRFYGDPPGWQSEIDALAEKYGEKVVLRFETYRPQPMFAAAERLLTDLSRPDSGLTHDGCPITATHVQNARKAARPAERYAVVKASKTQKIDACIASILAHEAAGDAAAAKLWRHRKYVYV